MKEAKSPQLWQHHQRLWKVILTMAACLYCISIWHVNSADVALYHKTKESRQGKLRRAKEKKQTLEFSQERNGITRSYWIEDPQGPRRQFFLRAQSAVARAITVAQKKTIREAYEKPSGWFQEELYWEIPETGERVIPQGEGWVRQTPPHQKIPERFYASIVPMQRVRFFDAASGEWDPSTNTMTATRAFFSILKVPGHDLPHDEKEGQLIARGTATSITFCLDKSGRKQISCNEAKLHINQGIAP